MNRQVWINLEDTNHYYQKPLFEADVFTAYVPASELEVIETEWEAVHLRMQVERIVYVHRIRELEAERDALVRCLAWLQNNVDSAYTVENIEKAMGSKSDDNGGVNNES